MKQFENKKRIVIKVGSSTLAYPTGHLNLRKCQHLIEVMSDIKNSFMATCVPSRSEPPSERTVAR